MEFKQVVIEEFQGEQKILIWVMIFLFYFRRFFWVNCVFNAVSMDSVMS